MQVTFGELSRVVERRRLEQAAEVARNRLAQAETQPLVVIPAQARLHGCTPTGM